MEYFFSVANYFCNSDKFLKYLSELKNLKNCGSLSLYFRFRLQKMEFVKPYTASEF